MYNLFKDEQDQLGYRTEQCHIQFSVVQIDVMLLWDGAVFSQQTYLHFVNVSVSWQPTLMYSVAESDSDVSLDP